MATLEQYLKEANEWWESLGDRERLIVHWRMTDNEETTP